MYLYLRGNSMKKARKMKNVTWNMEYCKIDEFKNRYPSGRTKRNLCILIELICFSNIVVHNELTSGMDPATRRYMLEHS